MSSAALRKSIRNYYETRRQFDNRQIDNESAIRRAFLTLLNGTACPHRWLLIEEHPLRAFGGRLIKPDATLQDEYSIPRAYGEAKDSQDDLDIEIRKKLSSGYPAATNSNQALRETVRSVSSVGRQPKRHFYHGLLDLPFAEGFVRA